MAHIVGCIEATELTTCKVGANQGAHIILRKSMDVSPTPAPAAKAHPEPGEDEMEYAALKAIAAMDDVTKAYFLTLDEEPGKAFLKKSIEDQKAEAAAAKTKADEAEAAKKTADELAEKAKSETSAAVEVLTAKNADLQAQVDAMKADKEYEKQASHADFKGYPGGTDAVITMLKSIAKVDGPARESLIDGMKAKAAQARATADELGGRDLDEVAKTAPATADFKRKVAEYAKEKSVTETEATAHVAKANPDLYTKALAEEGH